MNPFASMVCWLSSVLLAAPLVLASVPAAGAAETAGYVGDAACKECHASPWESHAQSFHGKAWAGKGYGCESCHGPAAAHVKSPGRETIVGPHSKDISAQETLCLGCHGGDHRLMLWEDSAHKRQDLACSSCHTLHNKRSDKAAIGERCLSCHRDVRAEVSRFSHHPITEGKVGCSDCHNPHGSTSKALLKAESVNLLCYGCHADKRGPFVRQHPPVEEDCLICHAPHGAKAAKLLTERVPNLCQECHNPDVIHSITEFVPTGNANTFNALISARACLNCHGQVHGSNSTDGDKLFR